MLPANAEDADRLRHLIHELAEALTAAGAFLHAGRQSGDPNTQHEAIGKAIGQVERANAVVILMRSLLTKKLD